jgi:hypothetical protein
MVAQMLRNPVKATVGSAASTAEGIEQQLTHVDCAAKPGALIDLLRGDAAGRSLIFSRTKHGADKVVRYLVRTGLAASAGPMRIFTFKSEARPDLHSAPSWTAVGCRNNSDPGARSVPSHPTATLHMNCPAR